MVERGRSRLRVDRLAAAARMLDVSTDYLHGLTEDTTPAEQLTRALAAANGGEPLDDRNARGASRADSDYVGVFALAASAGGGAVAYDERVTGRLKFPMTWLARHGLVARNCRVIGVIGESMEPTLVDGCSILVNHASRRRRLGHIYVVRIEEGLVVQRAVRDPVGACWRAGTSCAPACGSDAQVAGDSVRLGVQPSTGCADEFGEGALRTPGRGRAGRPRTVHASGSPAAVARPRSHRGRAGAVDAGVQDRSTLKVDALDGDAAVADGPPAARGLPPRRTDTVRRGAAREGRTAGGGSRSSARGWMRPASSWRSAPTGAGPARVRTGRWKGRPGRPAALRSPCIRSAMPLRRGCGGRDRTWRTSRICTGTRIRKRR